MSEPFNPPTPPYYSGPQVVPAPLGAPPAAPQPEPIDFGDVVTDLEKFRAQGFEGLGAAASIAFQPGGPGTEVFTVQHALLLSDEKNEALEAAQGMIAIAKALLNTDADGQVYDRFKAAGGRSGDIMIAWRRLSAGLDAPKSA